MYEEKMLQSTVDGSLLVQVLFNMISPLIDGFNNLMLCWKKSHGKTVEGNQVPVKHRQAKPFNRHIVARL